MAKSNAVRYICKECGNESSRWAGRCFSCSAWNSYEEKKTETSKYTSQVTPVSLVSLNKIAPQTTTRIQTSFESMDRVLGGGLVPGSVMLLGGEPGSGKSTLLLQYADAVAGSAIVYYLSGEESVEQIQLRASRLPLNNTQNIFISAISSIDEYFQRVQQEKTKPGLVIIDSIQTVREESTDSRTGSQSQVQAVVDKLVEFAKTNTIATFLVGHVTKEGNLAGPKTVEHLVDAVFYLEGDGERKVIRSVKNRFGSVNELAFYSFDTGYFQESEPSFLQSRKGIDVEGKIGAVATMVKEGGRYLPLEIQSLVVQSYQQIPRRVVTGYDYNRLLLLVGILEKYAGASLYKYDVFINVSEGIRVYDTAADVAVCIALLSSLKKVPVPNTVIAWGEVSLLGEVNAVSHHEQRVKDAERYGFTQFITPAQVRQVTAVMSRLTVKKR